MHLVLTHKLKLIFIRIYCAIFVLHSNGDVGVCEGGGKGVNAEEDGVRLSMSVQCSFRRHPNNKCSIHRHLGSA